MRNFTILLLLIFTACQSSSYYAAQNANQKRFDGWNKEDADFLMETHDLVLLTEALSAAAENRSNLKETYLFAQEVQEEMNELRMKFKLEAAIKRVKLASALSKQSDEQMQKLEKIDDKNFDVVYLQYMKSNLTRLLEMTDSYIREGHTERLKDFSQTLKTSIRPMLDKVKTAELS